MGLPSAMGVGVGMLESGDMPKCTETLDDYVLSRRFSALDSSDGVRLGIATLLM